MTVSLPPLPATFHVRTSRLLLLAFGCVLGAALGATLYYLGTTPSGAPHHSAYAVGGGVLMLAFALATTFFLFAAVKKRAVFTLETGGIRTGQGGVLIPWGLIKSVKKVNAPFECLGIYLIDTKEYYATLTPLFQKVGRNTEKAVGTPIVINPRPAGVTTDQLAAWIAQLRGPARPVRISKTRKKKS